MRVKNVANMAAPVIFCGPRHAELNAIAYALLIPISVFRVSLGDGYVFIQKS